MIRLSLIIILWCLIVSCSKHDKNEFKYGNDQFTESNNLNKDSIENVNDKWTEVEKAEIANKLKIGLMGSICQKVAILQCSDNNGVDESCLTNFMNMVAKTTSDTFSKYGSCEDEFLDDIDNFISRFDNKESCTIVIQKLIEEGYLKPYQTKESQ